MPLAKYIELDDGTTYGLKECAKCRVVHSTEFGFYKNTRKSDGFYCYCRDCCNKASRKNNYKREASKKDSNDWETHVKDKFRSASDRAREKGLAICSLEEWIATFWEQFAATNGRCPEMGIEYRLDIIRKKFQRNPHAPSPDQISPSAGYVRGNIRWVSVFFNTLKSDLSMDEVDIMMESYMYRRGVIEEGEIPQPERPIYYPPTEV